MQRGRKPSFLDPVGFFLIDWILYWSTVEAQEEVCLTGTLRNWAVSFTFRPQAPDG